MAGEYADDKRLAVKHLTVGLPFLKVCIPAENSAISVSGIRKSPTIPPVALSPCNHREGHSDEEATGSRAIFVDARPNTSQTCVSIQYCLSVDSLQRCNFHGIIRLGYWSRSCPGCLPAGVDPNRGSEETVRSPGIP